MLRLKRQIGFPFRNSGTFAWIDLLFHLMRRKARQVLGAEWRGPCWVLSAEAAVAGMGKAGCWTGHLPRASAAHAPEVALAT